MVRVLKGGDRTVCFTLGSGEHSTDDTGRDGYSTAKTAGREKQLQDRRTSRLLPKPDIPKECTIVVVAGPSHDYLAPEVMRSKAYVEDGGRALFLLDPPLEIWRAGNRRQRRACMAVLTDWGVTPVKGSGSGPERRGSVLQRGSGIARWSPPMRTKPSCGT